MNLSIVNKVNEIIREIAVSNAYYIEFTKGKEVQYYTNDKVRISEYEIKDILNTLNKGILSIKDGRVIFKIEKNVGVVTNNFYYKLTVLNKHTILFYKLYDNKYNGINSIDEDTKKVVAEISISDNKDYNLGDRDRVLGGITRLMRLYPSLEYKNVTNNIRKAHIGVAQDEEVFDSIIYYHMVLDTQLKPTLKGIFRGTNIDIDLDKISIYSNTTKESLSAMIGRRSNYEGLNIHNIDMMINLLRAMPKEILTVPYKKAKDIILEGIIFNFRDYLIDIAFLIRNAGRNSEYVIEYKSGAIFNSDYNVENVRAYINKTAINKYTISICVPLL